MTKLALSCLTLVAVMGGLPVAPTVAQEVVIATWGGVWGKAFQQSMFEPFEKATGIKVRVIAGVSSSNLATVAAQKDRPQIDVITMVSGDGIAAWQRGLTERLDGQDVPALKELAELALRKDKESVIFAGMWMYPMGILYRTDKITWPITSWWDLWDPRLKNKVAVTSPKYANAHFLAIVNKLSGGTEDNVDPGFAKIKSLGQNLLVDVADDVTPQRLIAQGEIWAVPMLSGSAFKVIEQGVPAAFVIPQEGAPVSTDLIVSADSHVVEPYDLWVKPLGARYGDRVPRLMPSFEGHPGHYFFCGREAALVDELVNASDKDRVEELVRAGHDPAFRMKLVEADGVAAEVVNATWTLYVMRIVDGELRRACCRVFNDWVGEYCSENLKRLVGVAMIPIDDVPW